MLNTVSVTITPQVSRGMRYVKLCVAEATTRKASADPILVYAETGAAGWLRASTRIIGM